MKRKHWSALAVAVGLTLVGGTALSQAGVMPTLVAGAPATTVAVPAPSTLTLTIAAATEIQIDATSAAADAEMALRQNGGVIESASGGGGGSNPRIVMFAAPGTYELQVWEGRRGAMTASVNAIALTPLVPVGTIAPGAPALTVNAPAGSYDPPVGDADRAASAEVTLTIATAGNYTIDAVGPATGCDAQLVIVGNNAEVGHDSDSGDESNARWTGPLTPGTYGIRVFDWIHRACAINVTVAAAP